MASLQGTPFLLLLLLGVVCNPSEAHVTGVRGLLQEVTVNADVAVSTDDVAPKPNVPGAGPLNDLGMLQQFQDFLRRHPGQGGGQGGNLRPELYPPGAIACFRAYFHSAVSTEVQNSRSNDGNIGATLLRLLFHDAGAGANSILPIPAGKSTQVKGGSNGSIMKFTDEQAAIQNTHLDPAYPVIERLVNGAAAQCGAKPSYADTIIAAGFESVNYFLDNQQMRSYRLGRADKPQVLGMDDPSALPSPFVGADALITAFQTLGLNAQELVVLSGAHTLGLGTCGTIKSRLPSCTSQCTTSPPIDPAFAKKLDKDCTSSDTRLFLDNKTPFKFDNAYFKQLKLRRGVFVSDQDLYENSKTKPYVELYAGDNGAFLADFEAALNKLSMVGVNDWL